MKKTDWEIVILFICITFIVSMCVQCSRDNMNNDHEYRIKKMDIKSVKGN